MPIPTGEELERWLESPELKAAKQSLLDKFRPTWSPSESDPKARTLRERLVTRATVKEVLCPVLINAETEELEIVPCLHGYERTNFQEPIRRILEPMHPYHVHQLPRDQKVALIMSAFGEGKQHIEKQLILAENDPDTSIRLCTALERYEDKFSQLIDELYQ